MSTNQPGKPPLGAFHSPKGWESAKYDSFKKLVLNNRVWFDSLTRGIAKEGAWRANSATVTPETDKVKHAVYVILSAQLRYWKGLARRHETLLKENGLEHSQTKAEWEAILAPHRKAKATERKQPKFGETLTRGYPWLDDLHEGPKLRCALGCSPKVFQDLRKDARIPAKMTSSGHKSAFIFEEAMQLLRVRFSRSKPSEERRREIAKNIWDRVEYHHDRRRRNRIRNILIETGAECNEPPVVMRRRRWWASPLPVHTGLLASALAAARG